MPGKAKVTKKDVVVPKEEAKNEEEDKNESGTDSDSEDDSIPELEETAAGQTQGANPLAAAAGLNEDLVSKAKQSRGEKKARKIMSKLGLKQVLFFPSNNTLDIGKI